jgi:hypothetical protein
MTSIIVNRILKKIDQPRLLEDLARLSGTELNSLLLEVFNQQAGTITAPDLLKQYQLNRFVKPSDLPVLELRRLELDILEIIATQSFQLLELSPVAALGSCSAVAPADQKKIISALRGTEVLADATNSIALHISHLKKNKIRELQQPNDKLRFGTIQRHVRTQAIQGKGLTPHFKIGGLVTSGMDTGNYVFEKEAMVEHMAIMKKLYQDYYKVDHLSYRFVCRSGYNDPKELASQLKTYAIRHHPEYEIEIDSNSGKEIGYYKGIQFKVIIGVKGRTFEIADGGFVDWTQQLLQNRKERLLICGFGFEFMYRIMTGQA